MDILEMLNDLYSKDHQFAYQTLKKLEIESLRSPSVYAYFNDLIDMVKSSRSYVRTRGLRLMVINAKWDDEHRIEKYIDEMLLHICDEKPITSRQFIQLLPQLTKYQPYIIPKVLEALNNADPSCYGDSMEPLVSKDIKQAIISIQENIEIE